MKLAENKLRSIIREEIKKIQEVKNPYAGSTYEDYKERYKELKRDVKRGEYTPAKHPAKTRDFKSIEEELDYIYRTIKQDRDTYKDQAERLDNEKIYANYEKMASLTKKVRELRRRV